MIPLRIHRRIVSADTARSTASEASLGVKSGSRGGSLDVLVFDVLGPVRWVSLITQLGLGNMGGSLARSAPIALAAETLKTQIVIAVRLDAAALHAKLRGSLAALPAQATHRPSHRLAVAGRRPHFHDSHVGSIAACVVVQFR